MKLLVKVLLMFALASGVARADTISSYMESMQPPADTRLMEVLVNGGFDEFVALIEAGADVNAKDSNGSTPLHWAASESIDPAALGVIELLVSIGADVNAKDDNGNTPLHLVVNAEPNVAKFLINKGADANAENNEGRTPLHWMLGFGGWSSVMVLVNNSDVDVNTKLYEHDTDGVERLTDQTLLHYAVYNDDVDDAKLLISKGADANAKDYDGNTLLCTAKLEGNSEMASILKRAGAVAERAEPYPVDDSASQTNLITSAANAAAMAAIVDEDNIGDTAVAAGQAVIDLSNAATARSNAKRAREKWERCEE